MADRFNLPCPHCAATNPVERRHAGQSIDCRQCGQSIEVPTLRGLQQLSPAAAGPSAKSASSGAGQFLLSRVTFVIGLVAVFIGGAVGGGLWYSAAQLVTHPEQAALDKQRDENNALIDKSSVTEFWRIWHEEIIARPPGTFRPSPFAVNRQIARTRQRIGIWFFGLIPLGIAAMVGSAFIRR